MKRRKFIVLILENIETDFLHAIRPPFRGLSDVPPSKSSRFAKSHSSYNCVCGISYTHHCIQLRNYPASIKVVLLSFCHTLAANQPRIMIGARSIEATRGESFLLYL